MQSIARRLAALIAALLIAVACSQTPGGAPTPQTDGDSPAVMSPDTSPDAGETEDADESDDADETEDADASPS